MTPAAGFPAFADFEVCGTPLSIACLGMFSFCDTVRVYFHDTVQPYITPYLPMFCANTPGVLINGGFTGGTPPFSYQWFDQPGGNGNIVGNTLNYFALASGSYSLVVYE